MTVDIEFDQRTTDAARMLGADLDPARVVVDEPELYAASALWNGAIDHRPALVVRCGTTAHVQAAVRAARAHGLPLSVRAGGHDWAGRAIRPGGLVVDLSRMRQVDVRGRTAIVDGGATLRDVAEAADRHGLAAVTGSSGDVGMAGLTIGGGYGPLNGRFGLAADNLLGAEVVLADGRVVDTDSDPGLLWALRGGGGNFGVVTSLRVGLHVVPTVLTATILFPWTQAERVCSGYAHLMRSSRDELGATFGLVTTPDGEPVVSVNPTWSGALDRGDSVIDEFRRLGTPSQSGTAALSPLELLRRGSGRLPGERHYAIGTRTLPVLAPEAVAALLRAFADRTAPRSVISVHHLHGAGARTPLAVGAFAPRHDHFLVDVVASWDPGPGTAHRTWVRRTSASLREFALLGGYPNLLGPDDVEQADHAYGPNTSRLLAVKSRLDPDGVFAATPLPHRPSHVWPVLPVG